MGQKDDVEREYDGDLRVYVVEWDADSFTCVAETHWEAIRLWYEYEGEDHTETPHSPVTVRLLKDTERVNVIFESLDEVPEAMLDRAQEHDAGEGGVTVSTTAAEWANRSKTADQLCSTLWM